LLSILSKVRDVNRLRCSLVVGVATVAGATGCLGTSTVARPPVNLPPTTVTTAPVGLTVNQVNWETVTVPGSVCGLPQPVTLRQGGATVPAPAALHAGTPEVVVQQFGAVYGDLFGSGDDVAVLSVWCTNTGGTADGQLRHSQVVFAVQHGALQAVGTLTPQQPPGPAAHVPYFTGRPIVSPGQITVQEAWYGAADAVCCPSTRAQTVWRYDGGRFLPTTTRLR
jgi:hypothetical protein